MKSHQILGLNLAILVSSVHAKGGAFYRPQDTTPSCPEPCRISGENPLNWTRFHNLDELRTCDQTVFFDVSLYGQTEELASGLNLKACTASPISAQGSSAIVRSLSLHAREYLSTNSSSPGATQPTANSSTSLACGSPDTRPQENKAVLNLSWSGTADKDMGNNLATAVEQLAAYLERVPSCSSTSIFALSGQAIIGTFLGSQIDKKSAATIIQNQFAPRVKINPLPGHMAAQVCGEQAVGSQVLGIFTDAQGNLSSVQDALRGWNEARCLTGLDNTDAVSGVAIGILPAIIHVPGSTVGMPDNSTIPGNTTIEEGSSANSTLSRRAFLVARADCKTTKVESGNGCWALADRCKISQDDIVKYNGGKSDFCNTLKAGQTVCCSSGTLPDTSIPPNADGTCKYVRAEPKDGCWALGQRCGVSTADIEKFNDAGFCNNVQEGAYACCGRGKLPDFTPKPNADGSCATYTVKKDETCAKIAASYGIKNPLVLEEYNKETWGWATCPGMLPDTLICVSKGAPPMPAPQKGAVCGPTVAGTQRPTNGTKLQDLNRCPLNVCCNNWGKCGLDDDFCVPRPIKGGGPGSAEIGKNGCVASCGMEITNNNDNVPIADFKTVGYFEAWNLKDRKCLHMDISKMTDKRVAPPGSTHYTHVHYAFADVHPDLEIDVSKYQDQFDGLVKLQGIKRIISLGGWAFSNDAPTYQIFRNIVATEENRQKFAKSVADFVVKNSLDGCDFDWEYPGATDIPGTPPGGPQEGQDYLKFLKTVRAALPKDKSVSIAAPSSFWYLQNFPIKEMSEVLDYIIMMTYDLHGQWDVDNDYANPGCKGGNCLRSHVNLTETMTSLAMITKAGVQAKKVIVGMPLYGRSFKMSQAGCKGPSCRFTGDKLHSNAAKGVCTDTAGYISNFEINQIISSGVNSDVYGDRSIEQYEDEGDILVYDETEWVSYLKPTSYVKRAAKWYGLHFGGTSDWAIDLDRDWGDKGTDDQYTDGDYADDELPCDLTREFGSLDDLDKASGGMSLYCRQVYALKVLGKMLEDSYNKFNDVNNGYDSKFDSYVRYMNKMIPLAIDQFMIAKDGMPGEGMKYFDCKLNRLGADGPTKPCKDWGWHDIQEGNYEMDMSLRDHDGFIAQLGKDWGIPEDWINLDGRKEFIGYCSVEGTQFCPPDTGTRHWNKYPAKKNDIKIPNPKEVVTSGIGNIDDLRNTIIAMQLDIMFGTFSGSNDDVVQVLSVPVFMLLQAVEGMEKVKELGEKQEEEDAKAKKEFILQIVSVVLMVVPFVGEELALAAGLANMARAVFILGETANAAFSIYEAVDDKDGALFAVMGMLFGVGGLAKSLRDAKGFRDMGLKRAGLREGKMIDNLGGTFKANDDKLQNIVKLCSKK